MLFRIPATETEEQFLARVHATWGHECTLRYGRSGQVVSAQYQAPPIQRDWELKHKWKTEVDRTIAETTQGAARRCKWAEFAAFYGATEAKIMAALQPGPPTQAGGPTLTDFIVECDPFKKHKLECPNCGNTSKRTLTMQDNPVIGAPDDPLFVTVMCVNTATLGGSACGHKANMASYLDSNAAHDVWQMCADWLNKKGVQWTQSANTMPSPYSVGMPQYQQFKVIINRNGGAWGCLVTIAGTSKPSQAELEQAAEKKYGRAIEEHVTLGTALPKGCYAMPLGIQNWLNQSGTFQVPPNAYPQFKSAVKQYRPPPPPGGYDDDYNPSEEELERDYRAQHPRCEADKEIGTRDVEKFQREERDRQMREMFGC